MDTYFLRQFPTDKLIITIICIIALLIILIFLRTSIKVKIIYLTIFSICFFYVFVYIPQENYIKSKIYKNRDYLSDLYIKNYKEKYPGTLEYIALRNIGYVPIYYINLDRSPKRRETFEKSFHKYKLYPNRISAIDGRKLNKEEKHNEIKGVIDGVKFISKFVDLTPSEIGCTISHFVTIEKAYLNGDELAIILEDDAGADLIPHWEQTIHEIIKDLPEDWTILNLFHGCDIKEITSYSKKQCWSTQSYIINKRGMELILEFKKGDTWVIDNPKYGKCHGGTADCIIYTVIPGAYSYNKPLFFGEPSPSDIGNPNLSSYVRSNRNLNKFVKAKKL